MPKKSKTVQVYIKCVGRKCVIKPSVIRARRGDKVQFNKPAFCTVYFQVSRIGRAFSASKKAKKRTITIPGTAQRGRHPYAAFCYQRHAFCTGSSMPIIIVPT